LPDAYYLYFWLYLLNNPSFIKKAIAIFLIFLLAFNACGLPFFYWVKIQLCKIKAEVAEARGAWSSESLVVFSSADKDVLLENSRELRVSGKMYDIVKTETHKGIKFYYAAGDNDEDTYISKLGKAEKKPQRQTSTPAKASRLCDAVILAGHDCNDFNSYPTAQMSNDLSLNDPHFYPLNFKEIFSPPPNGSFS
jgi:hypothetical protein